MQLYIRWWFYSVTKLWDYHVQFILRFQLVQFNLFVIFEMNYRLKSQNLLLMLFKKYIISIQKIYFNINYIYDSYQNVENACLCQISYRNHDWSYWKFNYNIILSMYLKSSDFLKILCEVWVILTTSPPFLLFIKSPV